ncbi:MAG: hypothetical protein HC767_06665 [Akkermansiaceae bacterium]|nr:hypothetical protein [Akkermansiaceae bacterium]
MCAGTWAGIQAASALQKASIDCEVIDVYSVAQAAAAVQAKVAVLVLNVTHINVWYDQHPGAIRDPQVRAGPLRISNDGADMQLSSCHAQTLRVAQDAGASDHTRLRQICLCGPTQRGVDDQLVACA